MHAIVLMFLGKMYKNLGNYVVHHNRSIRYLLVAVIRGSTGTG